MEPDTLMSKPKGSLLVMRLPFVRIAFPARTRQFKHRDGTRKGLWRPWGEKSGHG